jgi:prepilin-type N-terminal cleavage/methylation domain-containing protein/prepilin-type processing-associated H-X9-DG protein
MRRSGLTLIELLVALLVISLVMAIILPVFRRARAQARAAVCASNIRQILIAMMTYDADYDTLPPGMVSNNKQYTLPPGGLAGGGGDMPIWWWFHYLDFKTPRRNLESILICPDKNTAMPRNVLLGNYGVNLSLCKSMGLNTPYDHFEGKPLTISGIRNRSGTCLVMDSGYTVITWWHVMEEPPTELVKEFGNEFTAYIPGLSMNKNRDLWYYQIDDAIKGRHPGKTVNTGFVDGHMERKKAAFFLVEPLASEPNQYHNLSPLWEPE